MTYPTHLIPTTVVGSYPQPDWLIDRAKLEGHGVPRVHAHEIWRIPEPYRAEAQDDATIAAIAEMERAGIDIVSDGEMRRESYSNYFGLSVEGLDTVNIGRVIGANGRATPVARVVGKIRRTAPVEVRDAEFLVRHATHATKITVPGPFTLSQQAENAFYRDEEEMALDYAAAVNDEVKDLFAAGADIVQIDEPWMQARPEKARHFGLTALDRALDGVTGETAIHLCFGYAALVHDRPPAYSFLTELAASAVDAISIETAQSSLDCSVLQQLPGKAIILGVLDLSTHEVETPELVAARIRRALPYVDAARITVAPDCGMKYLPRDVAFGKLRALTAGADLVRRDLR